MAGSSAEDDLIATHFAPLASPAGLGLRDDAALFTPPAGHDLVVTADALVAGVHFFADDPPESIARKALRVNVSDLAAKGAAPLGFLLSLVLPPSFGDAQLASFAKGLAQDAHAFGCLLAGGDTVSTPGPLTVAITAFGLTPHGSMVPRTGARAGDRLYVTGTIGDAALGLMLRQDATAGAALSNHDRLALLDRYSLPQPRLALREALRAHASAAMDVSDGLIGDLSKMLRVSGVSGRVDLARVPLSAAARAFIGGDEALFERALTGGDDYEILVATPADRAEAFEAAARAAGLAATPIGEATAGSGAPAFVGRGGEARVFARGSFSHF